MASDTTGFRSLVQQIQERDREMGTPSRDRSTGQPPRDRAMEASPRETQSRERMDDPRPQQERPPREPRRDGPRRIRGRTDGMDSSFGTNTASAPSALLSRRWL